MAELMSNFVLWGSSSRDTSPYVFSLGESQGSLAKMTHFLQGLEPNPQWWEGRVRVQTVAEKGDKFNVQKAALAWAPSERQKSEEE